MEETVSKTSDMLKHKISHIWDAGAKGYDKQYAHGLHTQAEKQAWLDALEKIIGPGPKAGGDGGGTALDIADVGSGTVFLALLLAEQGHHLQAFDLSEGMLEVGRQKAAQDNLAVEFKVGDAEKLPLPDRAVDLTINRHVLWTLPNPVEALKEWKRVTKVGGRVIVIDGLWGLEASLPTKLQKQVGKLLISLQKQLNTKKSQNEQREHQYTPALMNQLPAMQLQNYQQVLALFSDAGLTNLRLNYLPDVDRVEKRSMPFANRLANSNQRHYVITATVK